MKPDWQTDDGRIQLYCGDCKKILPEIGKVDAVITDPPYGVNFSYTSFNDSKENLQNLIAYFVPEARRISKRMAIFTSIKNISLYSNADWFYSWVVPAGTGCSAFGFTCWTPIAFYGKDIFIGKGSRPDAFIDYHPKREGFPHPCEKPLSIMLWSINRFTKENEIILDPFMGSGTTGIACIRTGRRFIGIEISPEYFESAKRRIESELKQPSFRLQLQKMKAFHQVGFNL